MKRTTTNRWGQTVEWDEWEPPKLSENEKAALREVLEAVEEEKKAVTEWLAGS